MSVDEQLYAWFHEHWAGPISSLQAWWDGNLHHGCFCGAGGRCDEPIDGLDRCCEQHDRDYDAVGRSADTMWDFPDGLIETAAADRRLAECAASADLNPTDPNSYPDVEQFRQDLIRLFSTRADAGEALAWMRDQFEAAERTLREAWDGFFGYLGAVVGTADDLSPHADAVAQHVEHLRAQGAADGDIAAAIQQAGYDPHALRASGLDIPT